jgi:hypothetical protein
MPNPPKPIEKKRALGNPGKQKLPEPAVILWAGRVDPPEGLGRAGAALWSSVWDRGESWVSPQLDVALLERVCRALDRVVVLEQLFEEDPANRQVVMSINETDKVIFSGLGLLGFSPADRARLGLAEVKRQSKVAELREMRDKIRGT